MDQKDLRKAIQNIDLRLVSIESKLDERCQARGEKLYSLNERLDGQSARLRKIEHNQARWAGAAALAGASIAWVLKGMGVK